ncbi:bis(5'-nucleosyl)-tetraphosphatase (symmetrical) YqeK [bacterium]|nr:bis(5'-nucleosyl)-tetraphosphatase (symmetrical) YqeK [bacterium]
MNYTKISTKEITDWLKKNLNEKRYNHSIGTAQCAKELAVLFGINPEKAYIAGLLHDCAKCFPDDKLREIIEKNLDVDPMEIMSGKTLHASVGAYMVKKEFGVEDEEIISSIRWHTIGKLNMTPFEKIIFLADKIEPITRDENYLKDAKRFLYEEKNLDKAMFESYKETIKSLVERELIICPITIDIYNQLLNVK